MHWQHTIAMGGTYEGPKRHFVTTITAQFPDKYGYSDIILVFCDCRVGVTDDAGSIRVGCYRVVALEALVLGNIEV